MKIIVEGAAIFVDRDGQPSSLQPVELEAMEGAALGDEQGAWYLSDALGDAGIIGGKLSLAISEQGQARVRTIYWSPAALTMEQQHELLADTIGQWEDGVGSDGFALSTGGRCVIVMPRPDETTSISQQQDGRAVPAPSKAAIAAREGNLEMLRTAIDHGEEVDGVHRGYTPLHWALLYGQEREASYLIDHGADPNIPDKDGNTPLMLCAGASALDDAASERIGRLLLQFGARRELQTKTRDIARSRGKVLLLRLLT